MKSEECKVHRLVADVLVLAEGKVLLLRYDDVRRYDGQEGWFLPDDFLNHAEHPAEAVRRLLREQIGLDVHSIQLSHIESLGGEDDGPWHLIFHHKLEFEEIPRITPLANVKAAEWFPLDGLPDRATVAHHGWAIDVITEVLKPPG